MHRSLCWIGVLSLLLSAQAEDISSREPWTARRLQDEVNRAISTADHSTCMPVKVPPGDYYFFGNSLNVTHAHNLSIVPAAAGNVTLWFSGDAGINVSHSTNVRVGSAKSSQGWIVIDYDPPPPQHPTFREKSGITVHLYNCTRITVEHVILHAAPFMAVTAFQGGGDHLFRGLFFVPTAGRTLVGVRDALHFSDLRVGPTVMDSTIGYTGDDFFNVHSTFLLVLECRYSADSDSSSLECLLANPLVTANAPRNTVYGTFSTLPFIEPQRDTLTFYPWPAADLILKPSIRGALVHSSADVSSEFATEAQRTLPPLLRMPPNQRWTQATNQTTDFSVQEVYKVVVQSPENVLGLPTIGSIVTIDTIASANAKILHNTFLSTFCNIGRFKSPGGIVRGNSFRQARVDNLELSALPQWFEGPVDVRDIVVEDNTFDDGTVDPIHCGPRCDDSQNCIPGTCPTCPFCDRDSIWAHNITLQNNTLEQYPPRDGVPIVAA